MKRQKQHFLKNITRPVLGKQNSQAEEVRSVIDDRTAQYGFMKYKTVFFFA